jgi:hypothetical protein
MCVHEHLLLLPFINVCGVLIAQAHGLADRADWANRAADFGRPTDRELSEEALDLLARIFVADPKQRITLAGIQVSPRARAPAPRTRSARRVHGVCVQARVPTSPPCAATAGRRLPASPRPAEAADPGGAPCAAGAPGRARRARRPAASAAGPDRPRAARRRRTPG